MVHKSVLVADAHPRNPPSVNIGLIGIRDMDRPPAPHDRFVTVVKVSESVLVVQIPADGGMTSPWRAGANQATTIEFEHDVRVEGHDLKAGTYALFMAMETDKATLIFSKQTEAWGSYNYDESDDVLRVDVKPTALDKSVEWLKYEFIDHTENGCTIAMQWEKLSVPFRIEVDVENIVLARIREEFKGVKGFISANRLQASMYYFEKSTNLDEALSWAEQAVTGKPFGQNSFVAFENLANGYGKLTRLAEADKVMDEGLHIATLNEYLSYKSRLLAQKRADRAIEIMMLAKDKFGDVYAVNDALSYGYSAKGDFSNALKYANKALSQAKGERAQNKVQANVEKLKIREDINNSQ